MTMMKQLKLVGPKRFTLETAPIPEPQAGEVLIKVAAVGVCGSDLTIYRGHHPYAISPLVMGHEFAGTIAGCGKGVKGRAIGERAAVIPHLVCGACKACKAKVFNFCESLRCMGAEAHGAHAEYIAVPAVMAVPMDAAVSWHMAAMLEPACVGYHGARREKIGPLTTTLVVGAGPIGNFCMQSVKALGARRVLMADLDDDRLDLAVRLGADGAIRLKQESLEEGAVRCGVPFKEIDMFYDCVGLKGQVLDQMIAQARRGTGIVVIGVLQHGYNIPSLPDFVQHELRLSGSTMYTPQDYRDMIRLMAEKKVRIDGVITHTVTLEQVPELLAAMDRGEFHGFKVMVSLDDGGTAA
jgi:L-iditol 2-dehydrogenase